MANSGRQTTRPFPQGVAELADDPDWGTAARLVELLERPRGTVQNKRNYYRILHVQPDAPTEIIRMSYLTLMQRMKMHPDLGGDHTQAALINEAFATLMDPDRRALYDRMLALDRAFPGYRSAQSRARQDGRSAGDHGVPDPHSCLFCGVGFHRNDRLKADATCANCGSPLTPPPPLGRTQATRREMDRRPRRLPITFHLAWPPGAALTGQTSDVSTHGMRFTTNVDLVPNERIKIDCEFCEAVAIVRHSRVAPGPPGFWDIGVEFLTAIVKSSRGTFVSTSA